MEKNNQTENYNTSSWIQPWGRLLPCENGDICHSDLIETGKVDQVLEYVCRPVVMSTGTSGYCVCSTRSLRVGKNCEEFTVLSVLGITFALVTLQYCLFVNWKAAALVYHQEARYRSKMKKKYGKRRKRWTPGKFAAISGFFASFCSTAWIVGKLIRLVAISKAAHTFGIELVNSFAVGFSLFFILLELFLIAISWLKVVNLFLMRKGKKSSVNLVLLQNIMYAILLAAALAIAYFNALRLYVMTNLLTVGLIIPYSFAVLYSGRRLHKLMASASITDTNAAAVENGKLCRYCCWLKPNNGISYVSDHNSSRAIRAIEVYAYRIAARSLVLCAATTLFAMMEGAPMYTLDDLAFHPDIITEQLICLAMSSVTANVIGYISVSTGFNKRKKQVAPTGGESRSNLTWSNNSAEQTPIDPIDF